MSDWDITRSRRLRNKATVLAAAVTALPATAYAATPGDGAQAEGLGEIIVTAQKRAEPLQKTPLSISAMTAADLVNKGINDITDLRSEVPSLQITPHPNSAITARIFIRGVGNNDDQITQDPSVAVYLDGVYVARSQGLAGEVADLERIEVLRGPQGSLYGRNATGGAINFITKAPELGRLSVRQDLTVGNRGQFRALSKVNIPIGDRLAIELGYLRSEKDGFVRNQGTGVKRFGDERRDAYRAAVHWQPVENFDVRYTYDRSEVNDTPAYIAQVPLYPATASRPKGGSPFVQDLQRNDVVAQGHNLTLDWQVSDALTIKSITGFRRLANTTHQDYLTGAFGPFPVVATYFDSRQKQFSEELQLIGKAFGDQVQYVLGAYYFDESAKSYDISATARPPRSDRYVTIDNTAYALYGQLTYRPDFAEGLYLTGGVRWSHDKRKATLQNISIPAAGTPTVSALGIGDRSYDNVSPEFVVGYSPNADLNLYAKLSRGYKSGGFNVRASSIARFNAGFAPETLTSYEIGAKTSWFGNRLRVNVAAFIADYNDIQINVRTDPTNIAVTDVLNAGKARIKGVELDVTARPVAGLTLTANYAYLHARYKEIIDGTGTDITDTFRFVQAPPHSLTASAEYEFPETPIGRLAIYADYSYQSRKFTAATDAHYKIGGYGLLNGRITLSDIPLGFGNWQVAVSGKNLTNKTYLIDHFAVGVPAGFYGEPRTYGVTLSFKY
ncbi:TonB-dependent receptor [Caenibius sp. WL]|uniref:TonB-dependent receptor n=1 Tax=Caenibius sp. WL TaxID=2872646 RepID=UPI001C999F12|nr:TonB-dependent receptor [Caenibius sp. WL]QZP07040.1 TonB-dependent receptor [Caenibius sp. WL]